MRRTRAILAAALVAAAAGAGCGAGDHADEVCNPPAGDGPGIDVDGPMCKYLSSYRLFDDFPTQAADPALVNYDLATPLFTDYANKHRFIYVPPGTSATWEDLDSLDLPVGSVLVKTFGFLDDRRDPSAGERLIETRVLLHRATGWEGAAYVYDDAEDEATIAKAGAEMQVSWIHDDGMTRTDTYDVPNVNQCINCHGEHDKILGPLGPKARHLNKPGPDGSANQLQELIDRGALTGAPADPTMWPKDAVWDDPQSGTLEARATAYLDVNCSHCHNPRGAARVSGLDLSITAPDLEARGICKAPTAAGRGSGGLQYDIVPGDPDASIVVFRMSSTEADIKMPELGRNMVHDEGVALIRDWISSMSGACVTAAQAPGGALPTRVGAGT